MTAFNPRQPPDGRFSILTGNILPPRRSAATRSAPTFVRNAFLPAGSGGGTSRSRTVPASDAITGPGSTEWRAARDRQVEREAKEAEREGRGLGQGGKHDTSQVM